MAPASLRLAAAPNVPLPELQTGRPLKHQMQLCKLLRYCRHGKLHAFILQLAAVDEDNFARPGVKPAEPNPSLKPLWAS